MTCDADSNISVTVVPACSDDLLLRFPYDVNYDDISCHNAKGYAYGEGTVDIVPDAERGMVAEFDGKTRLEVTYMHLPWASFTSYSHPKINLARDYIIFPMFSSLINT